MKLWVPGDPGLRGDEAATEARERVCSVVSPAAHPYINSGLAVRFRFLHRLPAGPLAVRPDLPSEPSLLELVALWSEAVDGILWRDRSQLGQIFARREWGQVAGVEVSL